MLGKEEDLKRSRRRIQIKKMPAPRQTKVKVYLRSRPCENFANDMIEYGTDGKVGTIYSTLVIFFMAKKDALAIILYNCE